MKYSLQNFNQDMDLLIPAFTVPQNNNIFLWCNIDPVLCLTTEPKREQYKAMAFFQLSSKVANFISTEKWFDGMDMIQVVYKRRNSKNHLPPHLQLPSSIWFQGYHEMEFVDNPFWI